MKKTLAEFMLEDGQALRSIYNYLQESYDQIEGKTLEFDECAYTDELQFYKTVQEALCILIEHTAKKQCRTKL